MAKDLFSPPWFPFYHGKFNSATQMFTAEAIGAYIILLNYQWDNGGLPNDIEEIMMLCKCSEKSAKKVMEKFYLREDGLLWNERLEEIRKEQEAKYLKSKVKADKANETIRKKKATFNDTYKETLNVTSKETKNDTLTQRIKEEDIDIDNKNKIKEKNNSLSSENPKREREIFVKPEFRDVANHMYNYAKTNSLNHQKEFISEQATLYIAHYESNGWIVGKTKMKNWKAAAEGWIRRNKDKTVVEPPKTVIGSVKKDVRVYE